MRFRAEMAASTGPLPVEHSSHIVVGDLFLLVSEHEELLVDLVERLLVLDVHAVDFQTIAQRSTSGTCGEHDLVVVESDVLRVDDLVGLYVLQHAVLMYATGVSEGIAADDGFVGLHRHVHQRGDHAGDRIDLACVDVRVNADVLMTFKNHGDLLQ